MRLCKCACWERQVDIAALTACAFICLSVGVMAILAGVALR